VNAEAFTFVGENIIELGGDENCPCTMEELLSVGIEITGGEGKIADNSDMDCEAIFGVEILRNNRSRCLTLLRSRESASLVARFDSCSSTTTASSDRHVSSSLAK